MEGNKLKELALKATPGPWYEDSDNHPDDVSIWASVSTDDEEFLGNIGSTRFKQMGVAFDFEIANARFIAAANPAAVLDLIAQRDELLESLKEAKVSLEWNSPVKAMRIMEAAIAKCEVKS